MTASTRIPVNALDIPVDTFWKLIEGNPEFIRLRSFKWRVLGVDEHSRWR
jgi:hypothetical protein